MDRKWKSGASATPPALTNASDGYATGGNPGLGIAPSQPGAHMWHMVVEEILSVILAAGLTPDKTSVTQLRDAVRDLSGGIGVQSVATGGTVNNLAITNMQVGFIEFTPASDLILTGMVPLFDGQRVILSNRHATNIMDISAFGGTSSAGNQFSLPSGGLTLLQNMSATFRASTSLGKWIKL